MEKKDIYYINLLAIVSIVAIVAIVILTSVSRVKMTTMSPSTTLVGKAFTTTTSRYLPPQPSPDMRPYLDSLDYQPLVPPDGGGQPLTLNGAWSYCTAMPNVNCEQRCRQLSGGASGCTNTCTTSRGYMNWGAEVFSTPTVCENNGIGGNQYHCDEVINEPNNPRWKCCCDPPLQDPCTLLYQANFPNNNLILQNGCYRLAENVNFGHTLSVQYTAELRGDGYTITGNNQNVLIDIRNTGRVSNLYARNANIGFVMRNNADCTDCTALYNNGNGFTLYDAAILTRANAHHNGGTGIELGQTSQAIESQSNNQASGSGFLIQDSSYVYKGTASYNQQYGFALTGTSSRIRDSRADHNRVGFAIGFSPSDSPSMENSAALSIAEYNTEIGYLVQGKSRIISASRANNNPVGYSLVGNAPDGSVSVSGPYASASTGTGDRGWGIIMEGNVLVNVPRSTNNNKGILVKTGATLTGSQQGAKVCNNAQYSIKVEGGRVTGGYDIGPQAITGCETGDCSGYFQYDDCVYGGGSPLIYKGGSPAFVKWGSPRDMEMN